MSRERTDAFIAWLDGLEESKGWTDYRLSIKSGLSSSVFSKARQGILPKWDALVRIANAFEISPVIAFRKAGLLAEGDETISYRDWQHLLDQLPPEDEAELHRIAEMKVDLRRKEGRLRVLKPKRAG